MSEPARQLQKAEPIPAAAPIVSESTAIVAMIERAARDPNVDIDKMERLLQMQERVIDRQSKAAYAAALAQMQPELPVICERGKIKVGNETRSTYALWEDINEAIKPVLAAHGFAISFRTGRQEDKIVVTGILSHREGHSEETTMHLPIDTSGSKNNVQAVGSSTSYGKRYTASALLNLTSRGEDDDGRAAGGTINAAELSRIQSLIVEVAADIPKFCKYMRVEKIEEIAAKDFERAVAALEGKRKAK